MKFLRNLFSFSAPEATSTDRPPEWRITPTLDGTFQLDRWVFSHWIPSPLLGGRACHDWKLVGTFVTAEVAHKHIETVRRIEAMPVEYVR